MKISGKVVSRALVLLSIGLFLVFTGPGSVMSSSRKGERATFTALKSPVSLGYMPGEALVKFKAGVSGPERGAVKAKLGIARTLSQAKLAGPDVYLFNLKPDADVNKAVKALRADPSILGASPNYVRRPAFAPNDPQFSSQWGLYNTGQTINSITGTAGADIDAPGAWDVEKGLSNPITVGVIDSGIDQTHPDLSGSLWSNPGEIAGNGLDDDGNGYIDDTGGYNFAGISQRYANVAWNIGALDTYETAQSIKGTGAPLTNVGLLIAKQGSPAANIHIHIRSSLGGANLATATIYPGDVGASFSEVYKALSAPVTLTAGSTYYIVFHATAANAANYYGVADNSSGDSWYEPDPYVDGIEYWWNGASWDSYSADDWYFRTNPNASPRDDLGHGTHVSGIIAATGDNSTGVSGVSYGAKIMPIKIFDSAGVTDAMDVINGVNYAGQSGANVINMSLAGSDFVAAEQTAVTNAFNNGVTIFAAAGNEGTPTVMYPAGYSNVIGVGATDNQDQVADFSNYNSTVDLGAPGVDVYSTMPTYQVHYTNATYGMALNYEFMSGTSMATPMAAGVAALALSRNPGLTPAQVEQVMENNADDLGAPGRDDYFGYGRVNAFGVLQNVVPDSAPAAVIDSITPNPVTQAHSVSFSGHGADPDATDTITGYNWRSSISGRISTAASFSSSTLPAGAHTIFFKVKDNHGAWSPEVPGSLTVIADNVAPSSSISSPVYSTTVSKNTIFNVTWSAGDPSPSSGLASYDVQYKVDSGGAWTNWKAGTAAQSALLNGKAGKTYYFRARARDKAGNTGAWTAAKSTIVPYDNNSLIYSRRGFGLTYSNASSALYLGTARYSTKKDHSIVYAFTGKSVALVTTRANNRSKARIYIDGYYKKTVDTYSASPKFRQVVYARSFTKSGAHKIKIVNVGNRKRLDVDGLAVGR